MALPTGPFTADEKARIRQLGGWGSRWTQIETRLESAMQAIGLGAPSEAQLIRQAFVNLDTIDGLINEAWGITGVKRTGSVELDDTAGVGGLRSEGRRLVESIFAILECDVKHNYYSQGPRSGLIQYG